MLSHTFHGAGSHKKKLEKYERKRAAEQEARVTTDEVKSTLADALRAVQKQTGSAHLVVAVGHKNLAPTKMPSAATGSKKKVVAAVPEKGDTGAAVPTEVATLPVPATTEVPATTAASTTAAPTPAMPPVMKPIGAPGLKPIGFASTTVPSATIQAAPLALGGASRQKVAFGFGGGAASASTASKRKFEPDMGGAMSPQAKKPHQ